MGSMSTNGNVFVIFVLFVGRVSLCQDADEEDDANGEAGSTKVSFVCFRVCSHYQICKRLQINTVGTRNKEQVGKHRNVAHYGSFPYCESTSFVKLHFAKHQHSVISSSCIIAVFMRGPTALLLFDFYLCVKGY